MGVNSGNREPYLPAISAAKSRGPSARRSKGRPGSARQQGALPPGFMQQRPQLGAAVQHAEQPRQRQRPERHRGSRIGTLFMTAGVIVVGAGAGVLFGKVNDNNNMVPVNADGEPIIPPNGPPVLTLAPLNESVQNPQVEIPVIADNPEPAPQAAPTTQAPTTQATQPLSVDSGNAVLPNPMVYTDPNNPGAWEVVCSGDEKVVTLTHQDVSGAGYEITQLTELTGEPWNQGAPPPNNPDEILWNQVQQTRVDIDSTHYTLTVRLGCVGLAEY